MQRLVTAGAAFFLALGLIALKPGMELAAPAYALTVGDEEFAVQMTGGGPGGTLVFAGACQGPVGPADLCEEIVVVTNLSAAAPAVIAYELSAQALSVEPEEQLSSCFMVGLSHALEPQLLPETSVVGPLTGPVLLPGESGVWRLSAKVSEENECQGASAQVVVTLSASGSSDDGGDGASLPGGTGYDGGGAGSAGGGASPGEEGEPGLAQPPRSPLDGSVPSRLPQTGSGGWTGENNEGRFSVLALLAVAIGCAVLLIGTPGKRRRS